MQKFLLFFSFLNIFFVNHAAQEPFRPVTPETPIIQPGNNQGNTLSIPGRVTPDGQRRQIQLPMPNQEVFDLYGATGAIYEQTNAPVRQTQYLTIDRRILHGVQRRLFT